MLNLQKFLIENNGNLVLLKEQFGIDTNVHKKYNNLIQFTYNQIDSYKVKAHPIVRESRGIILDSADNWKVVARPFDRFFNYGENVDEDKFDWTSFVAQEKVDGSLMIVYHYRNEWHVATKGMASAHGPVGNMDFSFAELFWKTFNNQMYFISDLNPRSTYLFELTSKYNRVVTSQSNNDGKLTLIGVRDNENGREILSVIYREYFDVVRSFSMSTIEEILSSAKELDPSKQEGFVLVDKNFNRIKVKSEKYVLIHHLKDSLNDDKIIELIKSGEDSEVMAYFPDLKKKFDQYKSYYYELQGHLEIFWEFFPLDIETVSRKEFALHVTHSYIHEIQGFFFAMLDGKIKNSKEWLLNLNNKTILSIFKSWNNTKEQ